MEENNKFVYRFFDLGSMQDEKEWKNKNKFETTESNLPWPSENKPATNPNRSEIKKKTLPQLKKQPLAIDRYQLGKTIEDIVTAEKYFKRIQAYIIGHYPFENKLFK